MDKVAYAIELQTPSVDDYLRLRASGGLSTFSREAAEIGLSGTLFSAMALHHGAPVGMGRLIGDGGCFFQIVDIVVEPAHRGRGLGKAIMFALMTYVRTELPRTAYISLIADIPANELYEQFGFKETAPRSLGMAYRVF